MTKPGRNDPCTCGSGKKYKKCCLAKAATPVASLNWQKMRKTEGELIHTLLKHVNKHYGPEAVAEAWDEFSLWESVPMEPDTEPEMDTIFLPWLVFNWVPDNAELDEAEHYPEMQVALHYLAYKGIQLDSFRQRFIQAVCAQPYSFFMVTEAVPGEQMTIKDLLMGREITVHERQASATLRKGSIIYTRIMTMDNHSIMVGCAPIVIPPGHINGIIDFRESLRARSPHFNLEMLHDYDIELREIYYDIRVQLHHPSLPELRNTDDDPLQMTKLYYTLKCTPREALDALATLSMADADEIVDEGTPDQQGDLIFIEFPWLKKGNTQHAGWDNTVMGHITIDGGQLTIDINSQQRADVIKRKITRRLGKRATFRNALIQSMEKLLEERRNNPATREQPDRQKSEELMALPEVQEKIREMANQHWQTWPDKPLSALKGQTPHEAAKTSSGRERLEALLLDFESRQGKPQPFDPDVDALRQSLGLD